MIIQNRIENSFNEVNQAFSKLKERLIGFLPEIIAAFIVIIFTMIVSRLVARAVDSAMERTKAEKGIRAIVARGSSIAVWVIGIGVTLSILNVNLSGFFAGLGVTGAAIGFAVHDIIANFVAGIVLLSIRPFKLGDTITIDNHEGVVERVEIRVTVLKTGDGKEVSIPNAKVFSAVIVNHSTQHLRRVLFTVAIDHEIEFNKVQEVLLQAVKSVQGVAASPSTEVNVNGFTANAVNLDIVFWVEPGPTSGTVISRVKLAVKEALEHAQITMAPANSMVLLRPERIAEKTAIATTKRRNKD
jgi:small conductance mechanosensitive channel